MQIALGEIWIIDFTSIYLSKHVTPYMHLMAMHISQFLTKYGNLVTFTQQGMEKLNDQTSIDYARSTNHNYRTLEALKQLIEKKNRIEYLEDEGFERAKKSRVCFLCKTPGHNRRTCKALHGESLHRACYFEISKRDQMTIDLDRLYICN